METMADPESRKLEHGKSQAPGKQGDSFPKLRPALPQWSRPKAAAVRPGFGIRPSLFSRPTTVDDQGRASQE